MLYSRFCFNSPTLWHSLAAVFPYTPSGSVAENVVKAKQQESHYMA